MAFHDHAVPLPSPSATPPASLYSGRELLHPLLLLLIMVVMMLIVIIIMIIHIIIIIVCLQDLVEDAWLRLARQPMDASERMVWDVSRGAF